MCRQPTLDEVALARFPSEIAYDAEAAGMRAALYAAAYTEALNRESAVEVAIRESLIERVPLVLHIGWAPRDGDEDDAPLVRFRRGKSHLFHFCGADDRQTLTRAATSPSRRVGVYFIQAEGNLSKQTEVRGILCSIRAAPARSVVAAAHGVCRVRLTPSSEFALVGNLRRNEAGGMEGSVRVVQSADEATGRADLPASRQTWRDLEC